MEAGADARLNRPPSRYLILLLLIGPRGVVKTATRGLFFCPHCDAARPFAYRHAKRFFTLFRVPVVRLEGEDEYVVCGFCRGRFRTAVLGETRAAGTEEEPTGGRAPALHEPALAGAPASTLLVWESGEE